MKKDIHPKLHPVVFVDTSCGKEFVGMSTLSSKEMKKVDGIDHYVLRVEISSASHPFYTGKKTLVDTAGMVDKFKARAEAAKKKKAEIDSRGKKSLQKESPEEKIMRKAKEKEDAKAVVKAEKAAKVKQAAKKKAAKTVVKKATPKAAKE